MVDEREEGHGGTNAVCVICDCNERRDGMNMIFKGERLEKPLEVMFTLMLFLQSIRMRRRTELKLDFGRVGPSEEYGRIKPGESPSGFNFGGGETLTGKGT